MSHTMKAAVFHHAYEPLVVKDVPLPELSSGEVLVKVKTCSICRTDLQFIDRGLATFSPPPIILGHEISGEIEKISSDIEELFPGDRVAIPSTLGCGECEYCLDGFESHCLNLQVIGSSIEGGFAEYVKVHSKHIIPLPQNYSFEQGSMISNIFNGAYHVIFERSGIKQGDKIVIFGSGAFGLSLLQMAKILGADVFMVDIFDWKLQLARSFGADGTLNSNKAKICEEAIIESIGKKVDVVIDTVGAPRALIQGIRVLKKGGKLVLSGYSDNQLPFQVNQMILNEFSIVGTMSAPSSCSRKVIDLFEQKKLHYKELITHRFPLEQINEALNSLRMGQSIRTVIHPWAGNNDTLSEI